MKENVEAKKQALMTEVKALAKAMLKVTFDCGGIRCDECPLGRLIPGHSLSYCSAIEKLRSMDDYESEETDA